LLTLVSVQRLRFVEKLQTGLLVAVSAT